MNDKNLYYKLPDTNLIHTSRGIKTINELNRLLEDFGTGERQVFLNCREPGCRWSDSTSLSIYRQNPTLICPFCNSLNITAEWVDFTEYGLQQLVFPNTPISDGFPFILGDLFYYYTYHRHYQVEI